ncbi:MAG: DNA translocase FtsK, partial [bacterium]|nr:DNA translocase FtsK [bacterium]
MAEATRGSRRKKKKKKARRGRSGGGAFQTVGREVAGVALVGLALLGGVALWTFDPADPVGVWEPVRNGGGVAGATLAGLLVRAVGAGAAVPVVGMLLLGLRLMLPGTIHLPPTRFWVGALLLLLSLAALPELLESLAPHLAFASGGWLGSVIAPIERTLLSGPGALALNVLALLVGVLGVAGVPPGVALARLGQGAGLAAQWTGAGLGAGLALVHDGSVRVGQQLARLPAGITVWRERRARRARRQARDEEVEIGGDPETKDIPVRDAAKPTRSRKGAAPDIVDHRGSGKPEPEQGAFTFSESTSFGPYSPPDVSEVFQQAPEGSRTFDRDSLIMNSRILEKKLLDFGVNGRVVTVHPGPVITMYEFEPAAGVKVNRITNLSDDLALALRAMSIRIIAPIPGKSVVGIEVPNPDRETVYIRDLLESKGFRTHESKLTLALGKDIFGNPVEANLAAMPHLLVAGATGTGKSVFLNSLLCSILVRATPDEVKLLLVDPKMLELSIYEGIPHLIADVVTQPKRASAALKGIVLKMEERYRMMAALGVRNILQFNTRIDEALEEGKKTYRLKPLAGEDEGREVEYQRIPYIVVVIDELADLMVVSARDVEESLQRLAQMARASGIHLILATQRPSVDVLTGIIKANFPSRISFQVSSRTDSRTILDQGGADTLLGNGDMLFLPPGTSKLQRLHGSYVSEKEVTKLVAHLRAQGAPKFDDDLVRIEEAALAGEGMPDEEADEHYDLAVQIVAETRNASISYIQRRLKVGYNRAARMIEQM